MTETATQTKPKPRRPRMAGEDGLQKNYYFDNKYYTGLWFEYFSEDTDDGRKEAIREEIVVASSSVAKNIIRMNRLYQFALEEDLLQEASFKVIRDFNKFNIHLEKPPTAFNYLTTIIKNHLLTYISRVRKHKFHTIPLDDLMASNGDSAISEHFIAHNDGASTVVGGDSMSDLVSGSSIVEQIKLNSMLNILDQHEIGRSILAFLNAEMDGTLDEKKNARKPTVKKLLKYLKAQGFPAKDCHEYLLGLQSGTVKRTPREAVATVTESANGEESGTENKPKGRKRAKGKEAGAKRGRAKGKSAGDKATRRKPSGVAKSAGRGKRKRG